MIPVTTAVLVASGICIVMTLGAYIVGAHDPWHRRRVAADERAKAREEIKAEYAATLALAKEEADLAHSGHRKAIADLRQLREENRRQAGMLADANAALGRLDALADRFGAEGRPTLRRAIIAARRGCTLTEVELYEAAIA